MKLSDNNYMLYAVLALLAMFFVEFIISKFFKKKYNINMKLVRAIGLITVCPFLTIGFLDYNHEKVSERIGLIVGLNFIIILISLNVIYKSHKNK